jgi:hypothetical protein
MKTAVGYVHNTCDDEYLESSLEIMSSYKWVSDIVVLITNQTDEKRRRSQGKINYHYGNFGDGFLKEPEDGGFSQIDARNRLLFLLRERRPDWHVLLDSDEFFTDSTFDLIQYAQSMRKVNILMSTYLFHSPTHYGHHPKWDDTKDGRVPLIDPHVRIFSKEIVPYYASAGYQMMGVKREAGGGRNRTSHCKLMGFDKPRQQLTREGPFHIHFKQLFGPKRNPDPYSRWLMGGETVFREAEIDWPVNIIKAWEKEIQDGKVGT